MKRAAGLALVFSIIAVLLLGFWLVWPSAKIEEVEKVMPFVHKSPKAEATIDPPFGFHWGDSSAHVEALLEYSSAEIVMRTATGSNETWIIEGLIQPGLKKALFLFEKNALTAVELQCQYDAWPVERYRNRVEEFRAFFDARYKAKTQSQPVAGVDQNRNGTEFGYTWQLGSTRATILCRSTLAQGGKLSVSELIIRYRGGEATSNPDPLNSTTDRWQDAVVSPLLAKKLQTSDDTPPAGSDFGITNAKLLNASDDNQSAYALQLSVKLQPEGLPDPTKAVVEVNFYDTLAGGQIVLTDAQVNYNWQSHRDWKQSNPEVLGVNYIRKVSDSEDSNSAHRYFGYIASVYYDGRLESVRAEPLSLLNLFPVRTFVSPFESAQTAAGKGDYLAAERLYRRAADQGNLFALENLAWFYAHGKGVEKNQQRAAVFYERAALQNTPRALNALAWFLATCEDDSIRNGAEAIRHATKACELSYWQEWKYIDTLAAAWAETGDFKRAIEFEQQALELKGLDEDVRKKMEDRLGLYRKRQPVRE